MAALARILIACALITISSQCGIEKVKPYLSQSVHDFTSDLVKRIADDNQNHFIASGLSVWTVLSILSLGAKDVTYEELKNVLRLQPRECCNSKILELISEIGSSTNDTVLERSSSMFFNNKNLINQAYKKKITKTGLTTVNEISFEDILKAAKTINAFVSEATHGNIKDIVEPSNLVHASLVLVDALYFKGPWEYPFSSESTKQKKFYDEKHNELGDVNMMMNDETLNYLEYRDIEAKVLELRYGHSQRFSMLIFLPDEEKTVSSVLDHLKTVSLGTIFGKFISTRVNYEIPRFEISSNLQKMTDMLKDMGLRTIFSIGSNLSGISEDFLQVTDIIQKANVKVMENGTEASAATAAVVTMSMPRFFVANRPFIFMIVDRELEVAVFTGAYSKPSLY